MLRVVDLLNRYCNGRRCREAISEVIMLLALFNCGKKIVCSVRFSKKKCPIRDAFFFTLFHRYWAFFMVVKLQQNWLWYWCFYVCAKKTVSTKGICNAWAIRCARHLCLWHASKAVKIFRINTELQRYLKGFVLYWQYKHIYCRR